jgi:transposase
MKLPLPKIRTLSQFILLSKWSNRAIAKHLDITHKTVADYRKRLQEARLAWSKIKSLDDDEFHKELFPSYPQRNNTLIKPDISAIKKEMATQHHKKGRRTIDYYWQRFNARYGEKGICRASFYNMFKDFRKVEAKFSHFHVPGDMLFVDVAGDKVKVGFKKEHSAYLIAGSFGHSDYIFMRGIFAQDQRGWMTFMEHVFKTVGGVPTFVVTDNAVALRSVRKNSKKLTFQYDMFSKHHDFIPYEIPSRSPNYNSRAEQTVKIFLLKIIADAREITFGSIDEFNEWLDIRVSELNEKIVDGHKETRKERFNNSEKKALNPVNIKPFPFPLETHHITVRNNYKYIFEGQHYSIPHEYIGEKVEVLITKNEIEFKHKSQSIKICERLKNGNINGMLVEDMPKNHAVLIKQNKAHFLRWANDVDDSVVELMEAQFDANGEPDMKGREKCLKIQSLAKPGEFDKYVENCRWIVSLGRLTVTAFEEALATNAAQESGFQEAYQLFQHHHNENLVGGTNHVH